MTDSPQHFARLVSLACHDLRTPLATVQGFATTLTRLTGVDEQTATYLGMIHTAAGQLAELLDDLGVAARIEGGRFEPAPRAADTLELARAAAAAVPEGEVAVSGGGAAIETEPELAERALRGLARCAVRHGGLERLEVEVDGAELRLSPVTAAAAPIVLGDDLRDLGAAVGRRVVEALGGSVELAGETLVVRLGGT
jgi:signal transduction histidine kinase